jgi:hypothetical protein
MTSYLPPSDPRHVDRLVTENYMTPRQQAWLGRRYEKEEFTMRTNVQLLGERVTAALLARDAMSAKVATLAVGGRTVVAAGRNEHALRDLPGNCERSTRPGGRS